MTMDWTAGYVADITYTYGYYGEMNPLQGRLPLLRSHLAPPDIRTACELGFGQGLSVNLHAAASDVGWYGTDFNPSQAVFAQDLAAASGAALKLWDEAFADFSNRPDLPDFDFICLHGIWSWISDENRAVIVDFIRRKLKPGGLLYISYNTMPGWAAFAPLRHLMTDHAAVLGSQGEGTLKRVDEAMEFADRLLKTNPLFAAANPQVAERLEKMRKLDRRYLAHEYFNRDWHPMHFSTMARWLEPAKLGFAASAAYLDHVEQINLTPEQQAFLKEIGDRSLRESAYDFMINQQFRRDLWVKGPRRLSTLAQAEQIRAHRVVLAQPRGAVPGKIASARGEGQLSADVTGPILELLADHRPKSLGQIERALSDNPSIKINNIIEVALLLGAAGSLLAAREDKASQAARARTDRLNARILDLARGSSDISYLASPVTGGGIAVGRFEQLFLRAMGRGRKTAAELAMEAWETLSMTGETIIKDGAPLTGADSNLGELNHRAAEFLSAHLPCLRGLGIA